MINKRICLCFLVIIVVSGLLTACQNTTDMQADSVTNSVSESVLESVSEFVSEDVEVTEDIVAVKEYERAVAYGLVPEGWEEDLQKTIYYKEFCELISTLIQITKPEKMESWNNFATDAMASLETIQRCHAAIGLLYAAQALDICYVHECEFTDLQEIQSHPDFWNFVDRSILPWPHLSEDYQMLQRAPGSK